MSKFKVGDIVRAIGKVDGRDLAGKVGTVIAVAPGEPSIGVEFDKNIHAHSCSAYGKGGKYGHCWWCYSEDITLATPDKIVITHDGKTTLARKFDGDKLVKSATACCIPEDKFDFDTGARIAFDRLVGIEKEPEVAQKPKYFTGRVVCVDGSGGSFIKGKIYKVNNGAFKGEGGFVSAEKYISVNEINRKHNSQFIEITGEQS